MTDINELSTIQRNGAGGSDGIWISWSIGHTTQRRRGKWRPGTWTLYKSGEEFWANSPDSIDDAPPELLAAVDALNSMTDAPELTDDERLSLHWQLTDTETDRVERIGGDWFRPWRIAPKYGSGAPVSHDTMQTRFPNVYETFRRLNGDPLPSHHAIQKAEADAKAEAAAKAERDEREAREAAALQEARAGIDLVFSPKAPGTPDERRARFLAALRFFAERGLQDVK